MSALDPEPRSTPIPRGSRAVAPATLRKRLTPRAWSLWRAPRPVVAYVLAVDTAAVVLGVLLGWSQSVTRPDLTLFGLLALGAALHIEVARHTERQREIAADGRLYIDLKSMWSFAGVVLLPVGLALALVVVTFAVWWLRVSRRPALHRWVFSCATVMLASCAAWAVVGAFDVRAVLHGVGGPLGLLAVSLAAVVRWWVNWWLVVGVVTLSAPRLPFRDRLGSTTDHVLALGALALGIVVGVLAGTSPWLIPLLLVPMLTMHRGTLLPQFVRAASTDAKTGLATVAHWHVTAVRSLARARRRRLGFGVLMVDVDDFKAVNDHHGHLLGDRVLRAVADALVAAVRPGDTVGRFGGEEFVVAMVDVDAASLAAAAEGLRRRIDALEVPLRTSGAAPVVGLTVSVGTALFPGAADTVDDLVLAADTALYDAKRAGRNRVRSALPF